jgi:hypothetical protein
MNGHIVHRFVAGRGPFSSHQPITSTPRPGWGRAPLVIGHDGHLRPAAQPYPGPSAEAPALRLVDDLGREAGDLAVVLVSNNT